MGLDPRGAHRRRSVADLAGDARARARVIEQEVHDRGPDPMFCLTANSPAGSYSGWLQSTVWYPTVGAARLVCLRMWVRYAQLEEEGDLPAAEVSVDGFTVARVDVPFEADVGVAWVPEVSVAPESAVRLRASHVAGGEFLVQSWWKGRGGGDLSLYSAVISS